MIMVLLMNILAKTLST